MILPPKLYLPRKDPCQPTAGAKLGALLAPEGNVICTVALALANADVSVQPRRMVAQAERGGNDVRPPCGVSNCCC